ncbi:hypothetical protein FTZ77_20270 [Salmonella enterica]|nr:hypothetical protein [Salmonella enterica]EEB2924901.1 hypothetical protein [Salmonella enterica]EIS6415534.1 hypothetical protein [Salmonella enterica]EIS6494167.1 hypothetical protein [Salmonella enterica]EIS6596629.1 hypothetical protein [Salmonella enterica]
MPEVSFLHRLGENPAINDDGSVNEPDEISLMLTDLRFIFSSRHVPAVSRAEKAVSGTILYYGISDIDSIYCDEGRYTEVLRSDISEALSCFEPRLKNTVVTFEKKEFEQVFFMVRSHFFSKAVAFEIVWSNTAHHYSVYYPLNYDDQKVY